MTLRLVREERFDRGAEIRREQDAALAAQASAQLAAVEKRGRRLWSYAWGAVAALFVIAVVRIFNAATGGNP